MRSQDAAYVLVDHFRGSSAALPADHAALVLQPYEESEVVFYDEFMQAFRDPLPQLPQPTPF